MNTLSTLLAAVLGLRWNSGIPCEPRARGECLYPHAHGLPLSSSYVLLGRARYSRGPVQPAHGSKHGHHNKHLG